MERLEKLINKYNLEVYHDELMKMVIQPLSQSVQSKQEILPKSLIFEEDGIFQEKDNTVYPIGHPDLSTQPSTLGQRYGNLDIQEVLIANGRAEEIPPTAMIIHAFSFNNAACVPAICMKVEGKWEITNHEGITPDYTLVRYVIMNNDYYY